MAEKFLQRATRTDKTKQIFQRKLQFRFARMVNVRIPLDPTLVCVMMVIQVYECLQTKPCKPCSQFDKTT